jgi:hypothetical protein
MRLIRTALLVFAVGGLALAPAAAAKNYAPPGKAGTSEYAEVIPSGGGNVSTPSLGGSPNKTPAQISKLGDGGTGIHNLAKLGKTGAQAAQFAQQTAPTRASRPKSRPSSPTATTQSTTSGSKSGSGSGGSAQRPSTVFVAAKGSALSGIGHLIGGSDQGGIGILLPVLLGLMLAGAVGYLVGRSGTAHRGT